MKIEHFISQKFIPGLLKKPNDYISSDFDEPILKIIQEDESNPVYLLLGYDDKISKYYFTLEDNETSIDFYCPDGDLVKMFNEIMEGKGEYGIWVKG